MIIVSEQLLVWDSVADQVKSILFLNHKPVVSSSAPPPALLALNPRSHTFAIAFHRATRAQGEKSCKEQSKTCFQFALFDPRFPEPLLQSTLKHASRALLADLLSGGYILIDTASQVHRITSDDSGSLASPVPTKSSGSVREGVGDIFRKCRVLDQALPCRYDRNRILPDIEEQNGPDRTAEARSLSGIFDIGPSFILPAIGSLFSEVVDLFARGKVKSQP